MLEKILPYELKPFFLINGAHTEFLDNVMWLYSGGIVWIPFVLFYIYLLSYKKNKSQWLPVLIAIFMVFAVSTLVSSGIIKQLIARPRPTHHPDIMDSVRYLFDYKGGSYGFISGHSTNSFAFATFSAQLFRNRKYSISIFLWALVMVYSRMYLGVHFLSDIIGGILAGTLIGFLIYEGYDRYCRRKGKRIVRYTSRRSTLLAIVLPCYIALFSAFSKQIVGFITF